MSQIIDRLALDLSADEMKQHSLNRAKYHGERAKANETESERIVALLKAADEQSGHIGKGSTNNPGETFERNAKSHRQKERFFTFAAEHFVVGATYRLNTGDLQMFEIMPAGY